MGNSVSVQLRMGHCLEVNLGTESKSCYHKTWRERQSLLLKLFEEHYFGKKRKIIAILRPCRFQNNIPLEHPNIFFQWALSVVGQNSGNTIFTVLVLYSAETSGTQEENC